MRRRRVAIPRLLVLVLLMALVPPAIARSPAIDLGALSVEELVALAREHAPKLQDARAKVALARKLATMLHRLWVDGSEFRWGKEAPVAA